MNLQRWLTVGDLQKVVITDRSVADILLLVERDLKDCQLEGFFIEYFDLCRRKRNKVDYDLVDVVSSKEVMELIENVQKFKFIVLR